MKGLFRICFLGLLLSLVIGTIGVKAGTSYKAESVNWSNGDYASGTITTGACASFSGLYASWSYDVYGLRNFLKYNDLPSTHYYVFKKGYSLVKGGTTDGDLTGFMNYGDVDRSHDDDSDSVMLAFSVTTAVHIHQGNSMDIHTMVQATR